MLTKVQKWGNSLALRIPKAFALNAQLENDSFVEISIVKGKIIITPVAPRLGRLKTCSRVSLRTTSIVKLILARL